MATLTGVPLKKIMLACVLSSAFTLLLVHGMTPAAKAQVAPVASDNLPACFRLNEIRFDESVGGKRPTPVVPKSWKFVGISNGNGANENTLWFQDVAGNIFMLNGFSEGGKFILSDSASKLNAAE